jgi:hypothetical protein
MLGQVSIVSLLLKSMQGVHIECKEHVDEICFGFESQKRQHETFPLQGVKSDCC